MYVILVLCNFISCIDSLIPCIDSIPITVPNSHLSFHRARTNPFFSPLSTVSRPPYWFHCLQHTEDMFCRNLIDQSQSWYTNLEHIEKVGIQIPFYQRKPFSLTQIRNRQIHKQWGEEFYPPRSHSMCPPIPPHMSENFPVPLESEKSQNSPGYLTTCRVFLFGYPTPLLDHHL